MSGVATCSKNYVHIDLQCQVGCGGVGLDSGGSKGKSQKSKSKSKIKSSGQEFLRLRSGQVRSTRAYFHDLGLLAGLQRFPIIVGQSAAQVAEFAGALEEFSAVHADYFSVDIGGAVAYEEC